MDSLTIVVNKIGKLLFGIPIVLVLSVLVLAIAAAFVVLGAVLTIAFAVFVCLVLIATPFVTFFNGKSSVENIKKSFDKTENSLKAAVNRASNVEPLVRE